MWLQCLKKIVEPLRKHFRMSFTDAPIVVILGATGTGKSKLALEIAQAFDGEIISADSMQVYKGLDIISNKVTPEERAQVVHHMIDIVEPTTNYSVVKFRNTCLSIIEDLHRRRKLPIIVGGTNYYIEAVLWKVLVGRREGEDGSILDTSDEDELAPRAGSECGAGKTPSADSADRCRLADLSTQQLYALLNERDPAQAQVLHPNERRKILRSLEVTLRTGVPMSEHWRRQRSVAGGGALGGPLRFARACLLWLTAEPAALDARLDARVEDMIRRGLVSELAAFHASHNESRLRHARPADYTADIMRRGLVGELAAFHASHNESRLRHARPAGYTHGIFQSIGFKEFHNYLTRPPDADGDALLQDSVVQLQTATRRYARRQLRWVRRRMLDGARQAPPLFRLDATEPADWQERVGAPARALVTAWLRGDSLPLQPEPTAAATADRDRTTHHCSVCGVYMSGAGQRQAHFTSRRHRKAVAGTERRQARAREPDVPVSTGDAAEQSQASS